MTTQLDDEKCQHCGERPATMNWVANGGMLDFIHGMYSRWCEPCVLRAQIAHAEKAVAGIQALRARLEEIAPERLPKPESVEVSEELRAILEAITEESKRLEGLPYWMVGPRTFTALTGRAIVIVRQLDSLARRHTNFCELRVSPGLNAPALASEIAVALQTAEGR